MCCLGQDRCWPSPQRTAQSHNLVEQSSIPDCSDLGLAQLPATHHNVCMLCCRLLAQAPNKMCRPRGSELHTLPSPIDAGSHALQAASQAPSGAGRA